MGVKFLSDEWAQAAGNALSDHQGFSSAIQGVGVSLQFEIRDTPQGSDTSYYLDVTDEGSVIKIGALRKADVSVTTNYVTAAAISKGELNIQTAFFSGKLKVAGNLAKLMLHQTALAQLSDAVSSLDIDY